MKNVATQSLEDAKAWLRERFTTGATCPCCQQFVKLYRRPLNSSMAYVLILIYRRFQTDDSWLHVPSHIAAVTSGHPRLAAAVRGDWAKLKFWGLLEEKPEIRDDGSPRAGFYRITEHGRCFVRGEVRVPAAVYLYNEEPVRRPGEDTTSINEALGKKFNYAELMRST